MSRRIPGSPSIRRLFITFGLGIYLVFTVQVCAQGFGSFSKKKITLHRKLPPIIHFTGSTFSIKITSRDPKYSDLTGTLKDLLETELLKNNARFKVDANSPDLAISCVVTHFEISAPQSFTRNEVVLDKGKQVEQPVTYNKITGVLEVAYQARDTHAGSVKDADNVVAKYSEEFEAGTNQQAGKSLATKIADPFKRAAGKKTHESSGPPTDAELREKLLHDAVHEIAARVTATNEPVEIMLAGGKMDRSNHIAENGLWTRYLEELEQMKPLQNSRDDAYRLYNIGVAYEALAYETEDREAAKKFLQEAAISYGKAVDGKPEEKYFLEPQKRIETAMAYYRKLEGQQKAIDAANSPADKSVAPPVVKSADAKRIKNANKANKTDLPTSRATTSTGENSSASSNKNLSEGRKSTLSTGPPLTNDQIMKMFKAGVDEESIIATIHDAPAVNFDLSPDGQIQLASGGVKGKILAAMRQRTKVSTHRTSGPGVN